MIKYFKRKRFEKLQELAHKIRRKSEIYARKHNYENNLEQLCMITSYALGKEMKKLGMRPKFIEGNNEVGCNLHCWIEWRGLVIDLTATQFGCPDKVFIKRLADMDGNEYYDYNTKIKKQVPFKEKRHWRHCREVESPLNYKLLLGTT